MVHRQADVPALPLSFPFASGCLRTPGLCSSPCPPADEVCPRVQGRDRWKTRATDTGAQLTCASTAVRFPTLACLGCDNSATESRCLMNSRKFFLTVLEAERPTPRCRHSSGLESRFLVRRQPALRGVLAGGGAPSAASFARAPIPLARVPLSCPHHAPKDPAS